MNGPLYISVILPLKLEWEPCYFVPLDGRQSADGNGNLADGRQSADVNGNLADGKQGANVNGNLADGRQGADVNGNLAASIVIGDRVKVNFAGKEYSAVVSATGITPETEISRIKPISSLEEGLERILPEEIELWRRVSEYYLCSIGEVYKAAYPAGKINLEEAKAAAMAKVQLRRERLLEAMRTKVEKTRARLAKKEEMASKAKEGTKAKLKYSEDAEKIRMVLSLAEIALKKAIDTPQQHTDNTIHINTDENRIELSNAQEQAYSQIKEAFESRKPVLLHGVTGSGKTELYIKLAQEALSKGQNVLYLVPEIALSRQLQERLQNHFSDRMMVFHSGETASAKRNTAETIRSYRKTGENYIVLGTRSSLFLPHHTLGLVIVDEEHDSSYKQDSPAPRYNGRDTALILSTIQGCNIILGSATPSLEEMYNCNCGRHTIVALTERYHNSEESDIEIIDTKAERLKKGMHGQFSRKLIEHIKATMKSGGQVMILRSRRAWAPVYQCEECGEIVKCPRCNVSLSVHKTAHESYMSCHYCGLKTEVRSRCSKCNGKMTSLGAGTQRIEEEAAELFPQARIARLDSDTAQNKSFETKTIQDFSNGKIDILIGTQILSKGFDFSNLRMVAVIAADTLLGLQDFRADEKAIQLLEQFRGRCGRRDHKGLFVIQTSQPQHPIYQKLIQNEPLGFTFDLLEERKTFGFPPFSRIVELSIKDRIAERADRMSSKLTATLKKCFGMGHGTSIFENRLITGPYSPAVDKVADQHIRCVRITLKKDRRLKEMKDTVAATVRQFEKDNRYDGHIVINVDPV